jgi:hypothetical protein
MLDFLFGGRDVSRNWSRSPNISLRFELNAAELNGLRLGGPLRDASFLGPAEDRRTARSGVFCYHSLGLCVASDDGSTTSWLELVFRDEAGTFEPFRGKVTYRGAEIDLAGMTVADFLARFGSCYWEDRDEDETILFYEFPQREWQVEFDEQGRLARLVVTSDPLMASQQQRDSYGVTKSWPP